MENYATDTAVLDSNDKYDPNSIIYAGKVLGDYKPNSKQNREGNGMLETGNNGLFITDENGNEMNSSGVKFFNLIKSLTSKVFECNRRTGEISLKKKAIIESIHPNKKISKKLAELIFANIGDNAQQRILFRVGENLPSINFDGYDSGKVDMEDLKFSNTNEYKETLQACMIHHFIHERVNTENYEVEKSKVLNFNQLHSNARNSEIQVWNEMQNDNITVVVEQNFTHTNPKSNEYEENNSYKSIYYGVHFRLIIKRNNINEKLQFDYEIL